MFISGNPWGRSQGFFYVYIWILGYNIVSLGKNMVMKNIIKLELGNFVSKDGNMVFLVRCPKCGRENYAMNVSTGFCTWCGLDGNDYYKAKFKFNNGNGALLCSKCSVIIKEGKDYTEEEKNAAYNGGYLPAQYCDKCEKDKI